MRGRWKRSRRLQRHLRPRREVFDAVAEDHREEEGRGKEDINIQDTQRAVNPFRRKF